MTLTWLVLAGAALAVEGQSGDLTQAPPKGLADYLADLGSEEGPERLYAARYVRGELRRASRTQRVATPGSIDDVEARVVLTELYARVPETCASALLYANTAALCAEMLVELEVPDARQRVEAARSLPLSRGQRRRLEAAIARMPEPEPLPSPALP